MDNIFLNTLLKRRIILRPEFINKNFSKNIENILHNDVGDKCINEGFVKASSINIIKRSLPKIITSNFSGNLAIDLIFSADICKPVNGNVIKCKITRINKLGLQAEEYPLIIIIAKQYHNNVDIFKDLKVGDNIDVIVIGSRYTINDKTIEVIGKLTTDKEIKKSIKIKKPNNTKNNELTTIPDKNISETINETEDEDETEEKVVDSNVEEDELSDIESETQEKKIINIDEEEDTSQMDEDIEADENEDDDDMLEKSIEEEETEEEDIENY